MAYANRMLQPHKWNYGVTELETLGVIWGVHHFCHYLYGTHCDVFTDHEVLKALLNTPHPSGKLARWGLSLQELDIHIHYWPGPKNSNVDALSHYPTGTPGDGEEGVGHVAQLQPAEIPAKGRDRSVAERQEGDPRLALIRRYLQSGTLPAEDKVAQRMILECPYYSLVEDISY